LANIKISDKQNKYRSANSNFDKIKHPHIIMNIVNTHLILLISGL